MTLTLAGTVAPMKPGEEDAVFPGRVWFGADGSVAAVTKKGEQPPVGTTSDREVDVGDAFIYPGLVDLHSHLGYNTLPLWADAARTTPYLHHDIWPGGPSYMGSISWPAWTLLDRAPECVLAYVQVRALAGGTTSIQGWPNVSRPPTNALVRCVDDDQVGPLKDPVMVSALTQDVAQLKARAPAITSGHAFVYHCAEGQPGSIVAREFDDVKTAGCLQPGLAAIHCCALDGSHFATWKDASGPGSDPAGTVVWSPFSNLWLYGITTDVPAARANRLAVCIGTDWGPSGTKNLLGEIKVARMWSDHRGWGLADHDLAMMVTASPGDALGRAWQRPAGRLVAGGLGDAVVLARRKPDAWANLVAARESDVMLVVSGGRARYGSYSLMGAAGESVTTPVQLGRYVRRVVLSLPADPTQPWTWNDVTARLDAVREDAAVHPPVMPAGLGAPPVRSPLAGDPPGTPPIEATPDLLAPIPAHLTGPPPPGATLNIEPLDPLYHSLTWLSTIRGRGFHGGVLDGLAAFYR
jgi:5-methylthioadenosine/S-adenosylhomocysteine deaminase